MKLAPMADLTNVKDVGRVPCGRCFKGERSLKRHLLFALFCSVFTDQLVCVSVIVNSVHSLCRCCVGGTYRPYALG